MAFLKIVRPPTVLESDSTDAVVRRIISLCGSDGLAAHGSDRLIEILREPDDIFDVVNLLAKSLSARPSGKELSSVVTLDDLTALFDAYRRKKTGGDR